MSDRAYALRFISGKYQGGEYPLSDAGELVIGRSSEQDMVLIEDMVSRKHAKLTLASDQIMEAMQQADELSRGDLPASTAAVGIAMPLSPRLRELSADELDLLQLVHNYGVVQAVLDRAAGSDLEVSRKIASLIERGYLRRF